MKLTINLIMIIFTEFIITKIFISYQNLLDSNPSTKWRRARGRGCLRVIPILGKLRNMNGFWLRNFLRRFSPPLPLHTTNSGSSALSLISFWLLLATTPTCGSCQTKAFPYLLDSRETKDNDFFLGNDVKNFIYHNIWWYEWVMSDLMRLFSNLFFQFINFDKQPFILILHMYVFKKYCKY